MDEAGVVLGVVTRGVHTAAAAADVDVGQTKTLALEVSATIIRREATTISSSTRATTISSVHLRARLAQILVGSAANCAENQVMG